MNESPSTMLHLALPKGRMRDGVFQLLSDAGIAVRVGARGYRPQLGLAGVEVKILKPQSIVEMLHRGTRDVGFAGADWVREKDAELVEVLDTGMDRVRVVAAAPPTLLQEGRLPRRRLVVATEYCHLTEQWLERQGLEAEVVCSYGATEVFPPEDADFIVDNTATGATLVANGLDILDEMMISSTRLYAHPAAMEDPVKRARIDDLSLLLRSVLDARQRVLIEVNVPADRLEAVVGVLPCMKEATVSSLHGQGGFSVRAAVLRSELAVVVPAVKAQGGTDILVSQPAQIVP